MGVLTLALAACAGSDATKDDSPSASSRGPLIAIVDSVELEETDSISMGAFTSWFVRTPSGEIVVNDRQQARLLHFGKEGKFIRIIGSRGDGPGELQSPGQLAILPDGTTLVAVDENARRALRFSLTTGEYLGQVSFPFYDVGANWNVVADTVIMATNMTTTLVAKWPLGGDSAWAMGEIPPRLRGDISRWFSYGRAEIIVVDTLLLALLPTEPGIDLFNRQLDYLGTVHIPSVRRKGEPRDLAERTKHLGPGDDQSIASSVSGFHRLASGEFVAVHLDMTDKRVGEERSKPTDFRWFVSLVSPDFSRACVDGVVPISTEVPPIPTFRGDTMFMISRNVQGDDRVRTVVYALTFDTSQCDWVPTGGIQKGEVEGVGK